MNNAQSKLGYAESSADVRSTDGANIFVHRSATEGLAPEDFKVDWQPLVPYVNPMAGLSQVRLKAETDKRDQSALFVLMSLGPAFFRVRLY